METIYLGLGSNQGNPHRQLRQILVDLSRRFGPLRAASLFLTAPVSNIPQPDYLNSVVELRCAIEPAELLRWTQEAERRAGRVAGARNGPRPLDIDLLLFGARAIDSPELNLPHPRIRERAFVLAPLVDLAPLIRLSPDGPTALEAWAEIRETSLGSPMVRRVPWNDRLPSANGTA